ncbi:MAG TPA: PIN domain-containing protein [Candidatus Paceibacterota bacterium]|nr:PIN domain-containing protein [Candidatus Paceibacterota bacterium]HMO82679.1 PIN domain-containing protein [Candidatus Paceibacterota bacterium]
MAKKINGSLDTNTLLRLVLGDVPKQTAAVDSLLMNGGVFQVSDITIVEMVFVLEKIYHQPRTLVIDNINAIMAHSNIDCNRKVFNLTLPLYLANPKLSIVDCLLTKYAELNKATPLYTFDADLAKTCSPTTQLL